MEKKKILYIITIPDWGGAQRYVFDLAENLKTEFDVTVAFGQQERNSALELKCAAAGIKTHQFKNLVRPINPIKDISAFFEIKNYIKKEKPDIIHLNSSKAGIIGSLAKGAAKAIYTVHGWVFLEPMNFVKRKIYIWLEKFASRFRDKIIVLGEREKQIAVDYKICKAEKLEIIKHAIRTFDLLTKEEAQKKLNLPVDKKIVGTIANFFPSKGLKYLSRAAIILNDKNKNVAFVIIGDGQNADRISIESTYGFKKTQIKTLGGKENAAQYLKAFDIFVLPSVKEGAPYVILEAMSAGLPIVATDVGNIREMLQNYPNKIIVPPTNPEALAKAMQEIKPEHAEYKSDFAGYIGKMKGLYNAL